MALSKTDDTQCVVNVTGQQWWWEIDYPVAGGLRRRSPSRSSPAASSSSPPDTNVLVRGTSRDVIHCFWIPRLNGKRDMVPGRVQTLPHRRPTSPASTPASAPSSAGCRTPTCAWRSSPSIPADFEAWKANQLEPYTPPEAGTLAAEGEASSSQQCSRCHQVNGLDDADGEPGRSSRPDQYVYAGAAPNLTNLMTRNTFAGASFDLLTAGRAATACGTRRRTSSAQRYLQGVTAGLPQRRSTCASGCATRPAKKPMYADPDRARTDRRQVPAACPTSACPRTRSTSSSPTCSSGSDGSD